MSAMEHSDRKPNMDKPTAEQLLAEKAQLEKRLFSVNEQLRRIEFEKRAEALARAVKIMRDFELTIQDVRTSRNGVRSR